MTADEVSKRGTPVDVPRLVSAVWRIEGRHIVAALTRHVGGFAAAEDLAQEAMLAALRQWPESGPPENPAAWLTAVAKRRAVDDWRRRQRLQDRYRAMAHEMVSRPDEAADPDPLADDVLRVIFIACHPVLSRQAQVALTLRVVGGLTSEEIARAFLVPTSTIQQRIVRAKKSISTAEVRFELPAAEEFHTRLSAVLGVLYLIFNEAHSASSGPHWLRPELAEEAIRVARLLADLVPTEPEAHALVALLHLTAARFPARVAQDGSPVPLEKQDRSLWNRSQISRGRAALRRADRISRRGRGPYALQAAIAQTHSAGHTVEDTDWATIVDLYEALRQIAPSPVVELNHAAAVAMADGPKPALDLVDRLVTSGRLDDYSPLAGLRGELLSQLGHTEAAHAELHRAAELTRNEAERAFFMAKAAEMTRDSNRSMRIVDS